MSHIARDLNETHVRGVLGGSWKSEQVRQILSNEKYTGNALLWKRFRNNHIDKQQRPNRGELPQYYAEGTHPAIIDADTFAAARERLEAIAANYSNRSRLTHSAFSGIIVCGFCGSKYKRIKNNGRDFAWNCSVHQTKGKDACPGLYIREVALHRAAAEALGLTDYDDDIAKEKIESVEMCRDRTLTFRLLDGNTVSVRWENPPRSSSWTPEMKAVASARARNHRRN